MSSSSPVSSSTEFTHNSASPETTANDAKVTECYSEALRFEVSPMPPKLFSATPDNSSDTPPPPQVSSLLAQVKQYNADNPDKAEADSRSPSPLVNGEQETKLKESRNQALNKAVCSSAVNEVRQLIKQGGVDLLQVDQFGQTLLHKAISDNSDDITKALLSVAPELLNMPSVNLRRTPLHVAAKHGFDHMVTLLLSHNPSLDSVDLYGNTPLHLASRSKDITVYDKLVSAGADTTIRNKKGEIAEQPLSSARLPIHKPKASEEESILFEMTYKPHLVPKE